MEIKDIKKIIDKWATSNFKEFEEGVYSIEVDKRRGALSSLFSDLKLNGASSEDVRLVLANVLKLCVPQKKIDKKKQWGWAFYSATDVLSAYIENYGDPQIDVKTFISRVFPNLNRSDENGKKKFIESALIGELAIEKQQNIVEPSKEKEDTINLEEMFKPEHKPLDLSKFKQGKDMKIVRFDPEMDEILGLSGKGDGDV